MFKFGKKTALKEAPAPPKYPGVRTSIDGSGAVVAMETAAGEAAGAYPITPSTSLMDGFQKYCDLLRVDEKTGKNKFCIIQAEDELAAAGLIIGASWNGARAFTPTSGPGISLMSEFIGFAYYTEIPTVFFDIQRVGPSTGMPTRTVCVGLQSRSLEMHQIFLSISAPIQNMAMISEATVMSKPASRTTPLWYPPSPEVTVRNARSFMSTTRRQVTRRGSIFSWFSQCI